MASSTEQIDDLLDWHPGTPDAARPGAGAALLWGLRRAANSKALVFWLWLAHFLLAQRGAAALLAALRSPNPWTDTYASVTALASSSSAFGTPAFGAVLRTLSLEPLSRPLWSPSPFFVLFYGVLAGGAIAWIHAPRSGPLLAQFGAGCGTYVGRFVRLLAGAAFLSWTLQRASATLESPGAAGSSMWLQVALWYGSLVVLASMLDFARVRTVARDSRSMILEGLRSARFFVRHLPRTLSLQVSLTALGIVAAIAAWALAAGLRSVISPGAAAFFAEQTFVVATVFVRLAGWSAMLSLYQGITLERLSRDQQA
jgi:hypothetical protein